MVAERDADRCNLKFLFLNKNQHTQYLFAEAQGLLASEGGFEVDNYEMFAQVMEKFSSDKAFLQHSGNAAGDFVKRLSGATDKVFSSIKL